MIAAKPFEASDLLPYWTPGDGFFFEHRGRALAGVGAARAVRIAAGDELVARAARQARQTLDETGGFVVGALPFGEDAPATLVVPQTTLVRAGGSTRRFDAGAAEPLTAYPVAEHPREPLRLTPIPEPSAFVAAVDKARTRIRAGELDKVVLARMLIAQATHEFDRRALLARLRALEPDAFAFAVYGFIGASPELLVARRGAVVTACPLAGTARRSIDPDADAAAAHLLTTSAKDRHEHAIVADHVRAVLEPLCENLRFDAEPRPVATARLWHLATAFTGTLRDPSLGSLDLAALLHPTPAVCGTPAARAREAIAELEEIDRALYAGMVGWQDANGDGEWAVVLRCAEVAGRIALMFAGAGIVADSDPQSELAETDAKLAAMLDALGYA
ncbi:MAG TPA: isochorismate synthase [Actinomycetota bacterium]